MKLSFYTVAILALVTNGVRISSDDAELQMADFDYYSQIDSNSNTDTFSHAKAEGQGKGEVETWTDADCEQMINGMTVRLQIPEC